MAKARDLPHLLALLDDDNAVVQEAVARELWDYGTRLEGLVAGLDPLPSPPVLKRLREVLADGARERLRAQWPLWYLEPSDADRLERALSLIADFEEHAQGRMPRVHASPLSTLLDELADEFREEEGPQDALHLSAYLFQKRGISGAVDDYYASHNSNLRHVLLSGRGIPISLVSLYVLTARRLGLRVGGCNWPGHFLARVGTGEEVLIVDCFNEGRSITVKDFLKMQGPSRLAASAVLDFDAPAEMIVGRVLNNLARSFHEVGDARNEELMMTLLRDVENNLATSHLG